jgi:DNA-directed RNA polymerase
MSLKKHLNRLGTQDLTQEYACLNALQDTEWRINNNVLDIIRNLWDNGQEWGKLPAKEDTPLPVYPFGKEPDEMTDGEREEFRAWSRKRNAIYSQNNRSVSKRIQVERTLQIAEQYAKYDRFYYVWQNDFRSRKYASSTFLSPQSADWSKALLEFGYPVKINNWDDARWLCIHGANLYGNDKVSLNDRELWAWDFAEEAHRIVDNPYDNQLWLEADKPYQFLAWCFELSALVKQGWGFETRLPVSADGSCNGLQHLSAILLDEQGARATNLVPSDLPQDIYTEVAEATIASIKAEDTEIGRKCLAFGIDRKLAKRPVMIVPYSGTRHACRAYIEEAIQDKIKDGTPNPFGDDLFEASNYLAGHVWDAISSVIVSARKVMDYVKNVADVYAQMGQHMEWITPTGWVVLQQYSQTQQKRIKTHINGEVVSLSFPKEKENTVHRHRTGLGASPNFIHSLDAAAMTKTINQASKLGIHDYAMVHDSYGTHSSMMPLLSEVLREEFVKMYEQHDVLTELRQHAIITLGTEDVPQPPSCGSLDIRNVLKSDYFFA